VPADVVEAGEVAVVRAQGGVVAGGDRGELGVSGEIARGSGSAEIRKGAGMMSGERAARSAALTICLTDVRVRCAVSVSRRPTSSSSVSARVWQVSSWDPEARGGAILTLWLTTLRGIGPSTTR
jgi:hypothetical protein